MGVCERSVQFDGPLQVPKCLLVAPALYVEEGVAWLRTRQIAPHIARIEGRSAPGLDGRTMRHQSYLVSQRKRKRVEEIFGWMKTVGGLKRSRFVGIAKTQLTAYMVGAAYNLLRMARLQPTTG